MIASGSTIPLAIVAATLNEMKAPTKLRIAAIATAFRGESARVETLVAIELAVSWKPFVKSKNSATTTTATRVTVIAMPAYAFLTRMFAITLAAVSQASSAALERLVDVLPADHDQRVDAVVAEQRRERVAEDAVALVLERLQLDERLLHAAHPLQVVAGDRELLAPP